MIYSFSIRPAAQGKKPFAWAVCSDQFPAGNGSWGTSGSRQLAEKAAASWKVRWRISGQTGIHSEIVEGK